MNCLCCCCCCCCCGQASWEKEINIGFVYVNAMLKHHKPHASVSTETTKYDIFAAWFRLIHLQIRILFEFGLQKLYVARFLSLVWVVCNLLINGKLPLDRQVWRAHWSSSSVRYGWEWGTFWLSAVCLALCQKFDESKNVQNVQVVGRFLGCRRAF